MWWGRCPILPTSLSPVLRAGNQGWGSGVEVPELFPPLCATAGLPGPWTAGRVIGPIQQNYK